MCSSTSVSLRVTKEVARVALLALGDIPQGWKVKTVAEFSRRFPAAARRRERSRAYWDDGTIQWFAPSDLTAASTMFMDDLPEHITELGLAESSARLFPAFSVMMTSRATIGAIAINTHEACTNPRLHHLPAERARSTLLPFPLAHTERTAV